MLIMPSSLIYLPFSKQAKKLVCLKLNSYRTNITEFCVKTNPNINRNKGWYQLFAPNSHKIGFLDRYLMVSVISLNRENPLATRVG